MREACIGRVKRNCGGRKAAICLWLFPFGGLAALCLAFCPGRPEPGDLLRHRAALRMGTAQIAEAEQKLADDLAAGESEGLLEELDPFGLLERMVRVEPASERAMGLADLLQ